MTDRIRHAALAHYSDVARSVGLDPREMLRAAGIDRPPPGDPEERLPAVQLIRLLEISADRAGREDFGLLLAETWSLSMLGPVGLLVREEVTARAALQSAIRFLPLHCEAVVPHFEERGETATLRFDLRLPPGQWARQAAELTVGAAWRLLGQLIGAPLQATVCFVHEAPRDLSTHRRLFAGQVEFGADFNGVRCPARLLDHVQASADPAFADYMRRHLGERLSQATPAAATSHAVRDLVRTHLATGRCTADVIARRLGLEKRTLQRHLASEGTAFLDIVNAVRVELATQLLQCRERRLREIAGRLGFSDETAFSRWFRARFGRSPKAWHASAAHHAREPGPAQPALPDQLQPNCFSLTVSVAGAAELLNSMSKLMPESDQRVR
jgi:AraC-like DNA-binding protein